MALHLADPGVGAVTGYIKEGSRPANYMNRFVAYEYVNAQAGARRAQNVLGAHACLAGGAQLRARATASRRSAGRSTPRRSRRTRSRRSTSSSRGKRVVFEPHAIVWAEEPRDIAGLWKQRLRWGRGNVQITRRFRRVWLRRARGGRLGGVGFALIWFSVFLMPALMMQLVRRAARALLLATGSSPSRSSAALWAINVFTYLFVTFSSFSLDPATARTSWREGFAFPGLISLAIIVYALWPPLVDDHLAALLRDIGIDPAGGVRDAALLFTYVWLSASMLAAWLVKRLEAVRGRRAPGAAAAVRRRLRAAAVRDHRGRVHQGAAGHRDGVGEDGEDRPARGVRVSGELDADLRADARFERLLFWRMLAIVLLVAGLVVLRGVLG